MIPRREFLQKATGALAVFSLGGLAACGDDDFEGPSATGYTVWVAQRVLGVVQHSVTRDPIPGALVSLSMGFETDSLFNMGSTNTGPLGTFEFNKGEETGSAGDFWKFVLDHSSPVVVYIRLAVQAQHFLPQYPVRQFTRVPSKEAPQRQFEPYTFNFTVPMNQVAEEAR